MAESENDTAKLKWATILPAALGTGATLVTLVANKVVSIPGLRVIGPIALVGGLAILLATWKFRRPRWKETSLIVGVGIAFCIWGGATFVGSVASGQTNPGPTPTAVQTASPASSVATSPSPTPTPVKAQYLSDLPAASGDPPTRNGLERLGGVDYPHSLAYELTNSFSTGSAMYDLGRRYSSFQVVIGQINSRGPEVSQGRFEVLVDGGRIFVQPMDTTTKPLSVGCDVRGKGSLKIVSTYILGGSTGHASVWADARVTADAPPGDGRCVTQPA